VAEIDQQDLQVGAVLVRLLIKERKAWARTVSDMDDTVVGGQQRTTHEEWHLRASD